MIHVWWYIFLQDLVMFRVNGGKYTSTVEHLGNNLYIFYTIPVIRFGSFWQRGCYGFPKRCQKVWNQAANSMMCPQFQRFSLSIWGFYPFCYWIYLDIYFGYILNLFGYLFCPFWYWTYLDLFGGTGKSWNYTTHLQLIETWDQLFGWLGWLESLEMVVEMFILYMYIYIYWQIMCMPCAWQMGAYSHLGHGFSLLVSSWVIPSRQNSEKGVNEGLMMCLFWPADGLMACDGMSDYHAQ